MATSGQGEKSRYLYLENRGGTRHKVLRGLDELQIRARQEEQRALQTGRYVSYHAVDAAWDQPISLRYMLARNATGKPSDTSVQTDPSAADLLSDIQEGDNNPTSSVGVQAHPVYATFSGDHAEAETQTRLTASSTSVAQSTSRVSAAMSTATEDKGVDTVEENAPEFDWEAVKASLYKETYPIMQKTAKGYRCALKKDNKMRQEAERYVVTLKERVQRGRASRGQN